MSQTSEIKWERVLNFGKSSHILKNGKTLCGRDVSQSRSIVQAHPPKKCQRCQDYEMILRINPMLREREREPFSTSPFY